MYTYNSLLGNHTNVEVYIYLPYFISHWGGGRHKLECNYIHVHVCINIISSALESENESSIHVRITMTACLLAVLKIDIADLEVGTAVCK